MTTGSVWKPCKCGHELADHAQPGQGRSRLMCEHPDCECQDFSIDEGAAMTTGDAGKGKRETLTEDECYELRCFNGRHDCGKWNAALNTIDDLRKQLSDLQQRNSELKEMLRLECVDSCCTDDDIRSEAKKVLPPESVDGDSHGVPGITEIVCMLVKQTADLQQRIEELEGELEAEKSNDHWLGEDA